MAETNNLDLVNFREGKIGLGTTAPALSSAPLPSLTWKGVAATDPLTIRHITGTVGLTLAADGKVGVGGITPTAALEVSGTVKATAFQGNGAALTNVNDPTKVAKAGDTMTGVLTLPANGLTVGGTQLVASGGRVGVGTSAPGATLDINGNALLGYESSVSDFGAALQSGFYQNGGTEITGDVPDTAHSWTHLITARHSNTANNHQLQIAASYATNDKLYFRKVAAGGVSNPVWNELATRGQNAFVGNQSIQGMLSVTGTINAARSEVYFTDVGHNHTGAGNTTGHAAIENAADYGALMILGRAGTPQGRKVRLWDYLSVEGDMAILSKHAFRGNDSWLRLNQDGAFTSGVHTPGVFAPGSLNVGGVNGWGNPGWGNIWMEGQINKLDIADNFTAIIRAADLLLGYSDRRGEPGRALVDYKDSAGNKTLRINYGGDWSGGCRYYVSMDRVSSRKFKDNVETLASESAHEILDGLEPVTFRLKSDPEPRSYLGFIAEDVPQEVGAADREAVNTDHIVAVLTRVVKDQQQDIQVLRDKLLSLAGTTQYSPDR